MCTPVFTKSAISRTWVNKVTVTVVTKATVVLNSTNLGGGSGPSNLINPPGWLDGSCPAHHNRGHLIGNALGGKGDDADNLVTLTSGTNHPFMYEFEDAVKRFVLAHPGVDFQYEVECNYDKENYTALTGYDIPGASGNSDFQQAVSSEWGTCGDECCDTGCGGGWFGGMGALVMGRNRANPFWTTYQTNVNENQLLNTQDAVVDWTGGWQFTGGYMFGGAGGGCATSCSGAPYMGCGGLGPGIGFTYWGLGQMNGFAQLDSDTNELSTPINLEQQLAWIAGLRAGRLDVFREVFDAYVRQLQHFAQLWVPRDVAEDISQDVLFNLWQGRVELDERRGSLTAYLFSAVRNRVLDHVRHEQIVIRTENGAFETPPGMGRGPADPDSSVMGSELREAIGAAFAELSALQRTVLMLRWVHDLSFAEIATTLSISENAAKLHASRGRQALAGLLKPLLDE